MLPIRGNARQCEENPLNHTGIGDYPQKGVIIKKALRLAEVKALFSSELVFETRDCFLVKQFGKYMPNLVFVLSKEFSLDKDGKPISPIKYVRDTDITDDLNLVFNGDPKILFGDYWISRKGSRCFRPKNPLEAKHLLVKVSWGGADETHGSRGNYPEDIPAGVLYFRHARSNAGGMGYDYWVIPVDYHASYLGTDEYDSSVEEASRISVNKEVAVGNRRRHADLLREQETEADRLYHIKLDAEAASKRRREEFLPQLREIDQGLAELSQPQPSGRVYYQPRIEFKETTFSIGACDEPRYYCREELAKAREMLRFRQDAVAGDEAKIVADAEAQKLFLPRFEALKPRLHQLGWSFKFQPGNFGGSKVRVEEYSFDLSEEGLTRLKTILTEREDELAEAERLASNEERIKRLLDEVKFPDDLRFIFDESEATDEEIRKEAQAILDANEAADELDDETWHELVHCGYARRCSAIERTLKRFGGANIKLNIGSQSGSRRLAGFLAG